jgi:hypothetical protein
MVSARFSGEKDRKKTCAGVKLWQNTPMTATEIETEVSNIIVAAKAAFAGAGHVSIAPDMTLIGGGKRVTLSDERYVHPIIAARIVIKDGWDALTDRLPLNRDWDHWDTQSARVIAAAAEMNLGIDEL